MQGLSLGPLIAALKIRPDDEPERELQGARTQMAHAALAVINDMAATGKLAEQAVAYARSVYAMRLEQLDRGLHDAIRHFPDTIELRLGALHAERKQMIQLWREGVLGDEPRRELERELDLEEVRLSRELV